MSFTLPPLPYPKDALAPHISAQTLDFHHGKHHATYVTNLNNLVQGTTFEGLSLEDIITKSAGNTDTAGIFNNAAQVWNHTFYWHSMKASGGGKPTDELAEHITKDFGSYETFVEEFKKAATTQFGSGWAWLVLKDGKLKVTKTSNADMPLVQGQIPLLTCDVWEHAYYLDYKNMRPSYVETFLNHLVNWEFAARNYRQSLAAA